MENGLCLKRNLKARANNQTNCSNYICAMVSSYFTYNKAKVIQALRYHFISRREIKLLMILVNVFAILSAALFFFKKISPLAFLISSFLWFVLMILFWYLLPQVIYRNASTFKDRFKATCQQVISPLKITGVAGDGSGRVLQPGWKVHIFFICILVAGLFLSYLKMHLKEMKCMRREELFLLKSKSNYRFFSIII